MAGEFDFIDWIRAQAKLPDFVQVGPGDDLAVLKWRADDLLIAGADQVLDGVHFDSKIHSPRDIGRKAMNRNLSDCAAMACLPAAAIVTAALPRGISLDYAKEIYLGIKEAGDVFECPIVGGDTATWDGKLAISVAILGCSAGITPITRGGAKPIQRVYVTGALGGSMLGRHLNFKPRIHEARALAATGAISSMIDLSDGLSRDIRHICQQSGVGAVIFEDEVPVHEDAIEMRRDGHSPIEHALHDGEDHELLFTTSDVIPGELPGIFIGWTTEEPGVRLRTKAGDIPLEPKGWEHTF